MGKGGQRRTIELTCGWRCIGHPQEVNGKFKIHKRFCESCKEDGMELPEYSKAAGLINGWNGMTNRDQKSNQMLTTTMIDGVRSDILIEGVHTAESAMNIVMNEAREGIISISKKRRMKEKAKANGKEDIKIVVV